MTLNVYRMTQDGNLKALIVQLFSTILLICLALKEDYIMGSGPIRQAAFYTVTFWIQIYRGI